MTVWDTWVNEHKRGRMWDWTFLPFIEWLLCSCPPPPRPLHNLVPCHIPLLIISRQCYSASQNTCLAIARFANLFCNFSKVSPISPPFFFFA